MSDTKSSQPARALPLGAMRKGLTAGGVALVAINLLVMVTGSAGRSASMVSALLWGAAAVCFLGAFVAYMMEPVAKRESPAPAKDPGAPAGAADSPPKEGATGEPRAGETAPTEQAPPKEKEQRLMRRGNPLRWTRGGITAAVSSFLALLLMAKPGQWVWGGPDWGVPIGAVLVAIASWGVMDLLGTFDDPDDHLERSTSLGELAPSLASVIATFLVFLFALGAAQAGSVLPQWAWGIVVTLAFVGLVVAVFAFGKKLGPWAVDENGEDRPLWNRHGFWLVVIAAALLLPAMGTYALWDPWETHYGEVAREMLAKDDWISLWWAQDGWFWSKPVADMWMQAVAMATLGVHYQPDKMLIGDGQKPLMHPEWAVRAPVVLLTILAVYLLYKGVSKTFGRRAAFIGGVVLCTMPDWFFIAHQTMTDMPCVGAMTASMGLILIGLRTPEDSEVRTYEVKVGPRRWRLTAWHLVFGALLVCAIPQILYLLSRNFEFLWHSGAHGFRPHWDVFRSGSGGGNCGLPGNEECHETYPASVPHSVGNTPDGFGPSVWRAIASFEPTLQGLLWAGLLGLLLYMSWGERRTRRIYYLAAWFFAAVATLGKGPEGFGLPVLVTFAYLCASRPGEELLARLQRIIREITQFEIIAGLLIILVVAIPWWVAMYVRHGSPFIDRLIFHDMFNRAFNHVHDTNEGDDTSFRFYIWQLGYALFPWTGLAPLGLLWWLRRGGSKEEEDRADASVLLCMWFLFGFALFSFMGTKFHHYIFPAVPPIAVLIGVVLDDMLGRESPVRIAGSLSRYRDADAEGRSPLLRAADLAKVLVPYLVGVTAGVGLMVLGVARAQAGSILGSKPDGRLADPSMWKAALLFAGGAVIVGAFIWFFNRKPEQTDAEQTSTGEVNGRFAADAHASRMLAAGAVGAALVLVLVTRDLVIKPENADQPGAIRLLQLFTYNYRRAWPESLDFSAALAGFGALAVLASLALGVRAVRKHAVVTMCALGFVWAVWGLDVYMERTAQHWGQHEVIAAYYADRDTPDEILVAYQMNWKGENFYTGNHIPAFVSTGSTFTTWLKKKKDDGAKVMYFITEHGRIGGLKGEVGARSYREVTDKNLCNKFVLVRAEL